MLRPATHRDDTLHDMIPEVCGEFELVTPSQGRSCNTKSLVFFVVGVADLALHQVNGVNFLLEDQPCSKGEAGDVFGLGWRVVRVQCEMARELGLFLCHSCLRVICDQGQHRALHVRVLRQVTVKQEPVLAHAPKDATDALKERAPPIIPFFAGICPPWDCKLCMVHAIHLDEADLLAGVGPRILLAHPHEAVHGRSVSQNAADMQFMGTCNFAFLLRVLRKAPEDPQSSA